MGVTIAVVRAACNTVTGTQDITTTDLGGLTPKAALLIVTRATADGAATDHAVFSFGATDGTRSWSRSAYSESGLTTTEAAGVTSATVPVTIIDIDGTVDGAASFSAWITNGIRINWTNAPTNAYLMTVVLFAGTDLTVRVDAKSLGNTLDLETDFTEPGFTPDVVLAAIISATHYRSALGFAAWDGAVVTQRCANLFDRTAVTTTVATSHVRNDAGCMSVGTSGLLTFWCEFANFDANGFSVITRNSGGGSVNLPYLALKFGGVYSAKAYTYSTPTATGSHDDVGAGFQPVAVMYLQSFAEAVATTYADANAGAGGISVITPTAQYAHALNMQDNVTTSNTQSLSDDKAINLPTHSGASGIEATYTEMLSNGVRLNYSAVQGAAKLFPALAIGAAAAGGVPKHAMHYQKMRQAA